ncbi:MAG: hemolysin family protein [Desulfuromonadia bacterium]
MKGEVNRVDEDIRSGRSWSGVWDGLSRLFGVRRPVTEEDIQEIIDAGEESGLINPEENEMIRSIFSLRDRVVREIMVPRTDMACVEISASVRELLDAIIQCGHSRIPVYDGTVDNIVGIVYAKDLLRFWGEDERMIRIDRIMRSPYFVPESKNLEELLQEFRKMRVHLAVVIDEYGGTSGIVTIEDLLEEIVGDIQDEYDQEEELLVEDRDGSCTVDGRLPVEELEQKFGVSFQREKFDTVAGLIYHLLGRIPSVGDRLEAEGLSFTIMDADARKVRSVRVVPLTDPEESDG